MKKIYILLLAFFVLIPFFGMSQGVSSSTLTGKVTNSDGTPAVGALVVATHIPSNTKYGGRTSTDGNYIINGLRSGGPYTVEASIVGAGKEIEENVNLLLGQNRLNIKLEASKNEIKEVVVSANRDDARGKTGSETNINLGAINNLPTISRDFNDFARLTPEANINSTDQGISIAGMNNRYNSIYIDGSVNNDVFGLAGTGTNGGGSGVSPFSLDAIESFNVQIAPYDVRQGGFSGGAINAVTRSGNNEVEGSVYYLFRNQDLAGETPHESNKDARTKLQSFYAQTMGARIGMPLIKDKMFYFTSIEYTEQNYPLNSPFSNYKGASNQAKIDALVNKINSYGYDPGSYTENSNSLRNWKILGKLDWNINDKNKLSFRYSYNGAQSKNPENARSSATQLRFSNNVSSRPNNTLNFALELNSLLSNSVSNNLIFGYSNVVDDRNYVGSLFPFVSITDGAGTIFFGSETSSVINLLNQNIYTLTDNVTWLKGKHTFTFGTHNEFYSLFNSFSRRGSGEYNYNTVNDFLNNVKPARFRETYSLVDNLQNDQTKASADFNAMQLGLYAQDDIQINDKFRLSLGLRIDLPFYLTQPKTNSWLNDSVLSQYQALGYDLSKVSSGQMPKTAVMFSPRLGFNYDFKGDGSTVLRGGVGIFTSRIPFVWIGGLYSNDGLSIGSIDQRSVYNFNPDITGNLPTNRSGRQPSAIDLIANDFKLPQVLKASLAFEKKFAKIYHFDIEGMFSKTLNEYFIQNLARTKVAGTVNGPTDFKRDLYSQVNSNVNELNVISNTNEGHAFNFSAMVGRNANKGFLFNAGYSFGLSKVLIDVTSSVNNSNWGNIESAKDRNHLTPSYSDFDMGHRIFGNLGFKKDLFKGSTTTLNFFFNAQSGKRFSWVYGGSNSLSGDGSAATSDLFYVPVTAADINLVDNGSYTAAQQWNDLNAFISNNEYLNSKRGQFVDRNGERLPFRFTVDMRLAQEFYLMMGKSRKAFEITFDIFNFTNLLNNEWGVQYYVPFDAVSIVNVTKTGTTPTYTYNKLSDYKSIDDSGVNSSRWQSQIGLRMKF